MPTRRVARSHPRCALTPAQPPDSGAPPGTWGKRLYEAGSESGVDGIAIRVNKGDDEEVNRGDWARVSWLWFMYLCALMAQAR